METVQPHEPWNEGDHFQLTAATNGVSFEWAMFCFGITMNEHQKPLHESMIDWFANLGGELRAALSTPIVTQDGNAEGDRGVDPDFEGWLHGDPMVTKNPASRYGDRTPGYITGNGLGSMEIGAADD